MSYYDWDGKGPRDGSAVFGTRPAIAERATLNEHETIRRIPDMEHFASLIAAGMIAAATALTAGAALAQQKLVLKASDVRFEFYDKERLPTVSWVQVQRLVDPGFLVEIEVVAELP